MLLRLWIDIEESDAKLVVLKWFWNRSGEHPIFDSKFWNQTLVKRLSRRGDGPTGLACPSIVVIDPQYGHDKSPGIWQGWNYRVSTSSSCGVNCSCPEKTMTHVVWAEVRTCWYSDQPLAPSPAGNSGAACEAGCASDCAAGCASGCFVSSKRTAD